MRQTIHLFIFSFGLLSFHGLSDQKAGGNNYELRCQNGQTYLTSKFDNLLMEVENNDSLEKCKTDLDSIRKGLTRNGNSSIPFSLSDKWNLIYSHYSGWEHRFGAGYETINHCYVSANEDTVFTSKEIFSAFNIDDSVSLKNYPLNYFPAIYEREDGFNGKWTAILPASEYLIVRFVHSYPNGSATSWYKERAYYFRSADK